MLQPYRCLRTFTQTTDGIGFPTGLCEAKQRRSQEKGQDALHILGGSRVFFFLPFFLFENKHVVVPKPFHILKGRQSTNLWIGRPGTPVTNVISPWHRGFKPIQPPTHRPPLRLCHYNPQAGFLLPRWAGDSMCEQNSAARAAGRNYYLFPSMTIDVWTVRVLSHCMNTFEVWGDWTARVKKKTKKTQVCVVFLFYLFNIWFISSSYYPERLYLQWKNKCFFFCFFLFSRLIKRVLFCFSARESKHVGCCVVCWLHAHRQTKVTEEVDDCLRFPLSRY